MAAPYSQDLRERVASSIASGRSARATAAVFSISESTAIRWAQRVRAEGHAKARPMGGDRRSRLTRHRQEVLTLIAEHPDITLAEFRSTLCEKHGITVGTSTVCRFFANHKITLKKKACTPPNSSARMSLTDGMTSSESSLLLIRSG